MQIAQLDQGVRQARSMSALSLMGRRSLSPAEGDLFQAQVQQICLGRSYVRRSPTGLELNVQRSPCLGRSALAISAGTGWLHLCFSCGVPCEDQVIGGICC